MHILVDIVFYGMCSADWLSTQKTHVMTDRYQCTGAGVSLCLSSATDTNHPAT
jgi:hypothetical protein